MATDSVFILFKKTDFNTILACLGVRCINGGVHNSFVTEMGGGVTIVLLCKFGTPSAKEK